MKPATWAQWRAGAPAAPFRALEEVLANLPADRWPSPEEWSTLAARRNVRNAGGLPLRFVAASSDGMGALDFEQRIFGRGEVETRPDNWHDAFHALAWLQFPRGKARINALHVEHGASGAPNARSPLRDLLTLFDESGIIIACADPVLENLLRDFQWHELFWNRRAAVQTSMHFTLFGHALCEQALSPYDGVTGKGVILPVTPDYFALDAQARLAYLDAEIEKLFATAALASPDDLQPLPLKGIPGWAPENEREDYYRDERQFRPGRTRKRSA